MSTNFRPTQAAIPLASILALVATGGGIQSLLNPVGFSSTIGVPVTSTNSPAIPFIRFAGARNLSNGVGIAALLYFGQRRAAGIAILAGTITSYADAWICYKHASDGGSAIGHAVVGLLVAAVGCGLYWG